MDKRKYYKGQNASESSDEVATKLFMEKVANLFLISNSRETRKHILLMVEHDRNSQFFFIQALEYHLKKMAKKDEDYDSKTSVSISESVEKFYTSENGEGLTMWNVGLNEEANFRFPNFNVDLHSIGSLFQGTEEASENLLRQLTYYDKSNNSLSGLHCTPDTSTSFGVYTSSSLGHLSYLADDEGKKIAPPSCRDSNSLSGKEGNAYDFI